MTIFKGYKVSYTTNIILYTNTIDNYDIDFMIFRSKNIKCKIKIKSVKKGFNPKD